MKIAVIGSRGIPNYYGGFEQFAEYISVGLVNRGHQVTVINSHKHPYQKKDYKGVEIIHAFDPEYKLGTVGQFIYDFNGIRKLHSRNFDIILQLGYTSSSIWGRLLPRKPIIVTNMDGLEWKRSKFSRNVQQFLKHAERWAVRSSNHWVADSTGIQSYLSEQYNIKSTYIPYGAEIYSEAKEGFLAEYELQKNSYNMLVARLEPENNIEMILDGVFNVNDSVPFIVIGKYDSSYGKYLRERYRDNSNIHFLGGIYDQDKLSSIRFYSKLYFHGHSVGGTNPSLLEAMACSTFVCAHDNVFNTSILGDDALYFKTVTDVEKILVREINKIRKESTKNNLGKIQKYYNWEIVVNQYENLFANLISLNNQR